MLKNNCTKFGPLCLDIKLHNYIDQEVSGFVEESDFSVASYKDGDRIVKGRLVFENCELRTYMALAMTWK